MRIVIISDYNTPELYMIEQVQREYPEAMVIIPHHVASDWKPEPFYKKKNWPLHFINAVTWKIHRELWNRKFYPNKEFPKLSNTIPVVWSELNKEAGINLLKRLDPDILIVNRAPILSSELVNIPKLAVNIHVGIPPFYRGNDTVFWPLYKRDYDHVGGCIHVISNRVDGGDILAEVYPSLSPSDGEVTIEYKITLLLTEALLDLLKNAEMTDCKLQGKPQTEKGRNYKSTERSLFISSWYLMKRMMGFSRPARRAERVVPHFKADYSGEKTTSKK